MPIPLRARCNCPHLSTVSHCRVWVVWDGHAPTGSQRAIGPFRTWLENDKRSAIGAERAGDGMSQAPWHLPYTPGKLDHAKEGMRQT